MKKIFKKRNIMRIVAVLTLLGTLLPIFAACDVSVGDKNNGGSNGVPNTPLSANMYNKSRNVVTTAQEMDNCEYELQASYRNGNYYVFQFYLGCVEFVPLQEVDCWYWNANSEYEKTLTTQSTTTEEIREASSDMISDTTYDSWTGVSDVDVSIGVETSFKTPLETAKTKMTAELNVGYSHTRHKGNDITKTASYSYENASSNSQTSIKSETYKFDATCPEGWYRLVYMGCFDIFTMVVVDLRDNTYSIYNTSYLYRVGSCLDYCEDSKFPSNSEKDLEFDISYLDDLVIPEDIQNPETNHGIIIFDANGGEGKMQTSEVPCDESFTLPANQFTKSGYVFDGWIDSDGTTYADGATVKNITGAGEVIMLCAKWTKKVFTASNSSFNKTITDDGVWGASGSGKIELDFSEYKDLLSDNYLFAFTINLLCSEVDDGYQELYLYNQSVSDSNNSLSMKQAKQKGLVTGVEFEIGSTSPKNLSFTLIVSGKDVKEKMYVVFDAWGNKEDTWTVYRYDIQATFDDCTTITAFDHDSGKTITDDGYFGIGANHQDVIDCSQLSRYMNADYQFEIVFSIACSEEDEGYQEIFLYDRSTAGSGETLDAAKANGMVAGVRFCHTPGEKSSEKRFFIISDKDSGSESEIWGLTVSGEKMKDTMYVRYDAHGNGDDNWKIYNATVIIRVIPKA